MPEWLEWLRIVATIGVWIVLPIQLAMIWRSIRQYRAWERRENASMDRWTREMAEVARLRAEARQLKLEATIEMTKAQGRLPPEYPANGRLH